MISNKKGTKRTTFILLTAALRKRSARQVAGLLAWVQGLTPHPGQGLTLLVPAGDAEPAPPARPWKGG